jgi:alkanesulfonate monooxygenase SsuD/methylene tetrahydromethanopterin reductase-like flavin-dependent oxidoreductase (luciferase family)
VALAAVACATEQLRLGTMVTPLSRRRVHTLARETVTLDHLGRGRLTLGVGLGIERNDELEPFAEVVDARERARLLDRGLLSLNAFWEAEDSELKAITGLLPSREPEQAWRMAELRLHLRRGVRASCH